MLSTTEPEVPAVQPPRSNGVRTSTELKAEQTKLESLVHHQRCCPHDQPLEEVQRLFRESTVDYFALERDGRVSGICARSRVGFMLGSRVGFSLNSRTPASAAQVAHPLVFTPNTSVRRILDRALSRPADEFHEDVLLVDDESRLIGLIPTQALARLQSQLVEEQLGALKERHETEHRQNLELFQANQALRQTQGLYRVLFESNAAGVALLDARGEVQGHNRRFSELLGLAAESGEPFSLVDRVTEEERRGFGQWLSELDRDRGSAHAREFHFDLDARGRRLMRISVGYIPETSQISACFDDVTEQRMIEQHLQKQEKQQMLDTLVGGIAHELNNKLTPVLGFAELLELQVDERGRGYLGYIGKSVEEAARIIRQLLQLSKPQIGAPEVVSLATIVGDVVTMLKFQLQEARTVVRTLAPPEPVRVFADPAQLKQVVMNLVINALHAMEDVPRPRLEITINRQGASGRLEVTDNGSGIPANIIGRIFDPFFTTKGPDKGSGLGLSICASLVRQQGGELTVTSVEGQGARFSVCLPLAASDVMTATPFAKFNRADSIKSAWAGLRVLVVEDEVVVRHFLQEALRSGFGCRVDVASDGLDGLRRAAQIDYALVVSDVRMPGLNGPEFYRKLTGLRPTAAGRFVFVTGHEGEQSLGELLAGASVPVMAKPFTMQQLQKACGPILSAAVGRP